MTMNAEANVEAGLPWRRLYAADVTPGTEPFEQIIRALRSGEIEFNKMHEVERRTKESRKESNCASTPALNSNPSEKFPSVETSPPAKRMHTGQPFATCTASDKFQREFQPPAEMAATTASVFSSYESSSLGACLVVCPSVADKSDDATSCARLTEKLLKVSQIDKTVPSCSTKVQGRSKYKPPYKLEKSSKPDLSMKNLKQAAICCDPTTGKMTYRLNHSSSAVVTTQTCQLQKVADMSREELNAVESLLVAAEEVACSLYFSNSRWQLREASVKSSSISKRAEVDGICILVLPKKDINVTIKYLLVSLDSSQCAFHKWSRRVLCALMASEKCQKICYGAQEIVEVLYTHYNPPVKECLQWRVLDVQVGCWLLDPDHPPHSYANCCKFLSIDYTTSDEGDGNREQLFCADMSTLAPATSVLTDRLKDSHLWQLYYELEVKIIPLLAVMQNTGIHLDSAKLLEYSDMLKARLTMIESEAHKAAGHKFLLSSTHQLRQVLFDELALHEKYYRPLSKTASQKFTSTSEHVLAQLQDVHPLPGLILEYRHFAKTKSTYIDGILPYISNEGTLKPFWLHTGTATGRLVSINPNIQAFPKQPITLEVKNSFIVGKENEKVEILIREAVESRENCSFLSADFKSIELRVLAHFSKDRGLLKVLHVTDPQNDVFVSLACNWLHAEADQVTTTEREKTKRVVYAVVYGIGKDKLANILNIHPAHAKELMDSFLEQFSGIQAFIQTTIATCRKQGYVTTLMNRRRYFSDINSDNYMTRSHAERQAVNFVIQGSAADICKIAMLKVMETLMQVTDQVKLLLQIHDELLFELPTKDLHHLAGVIHTSLESHKDMLTVPLQVRISAGQTWASMQLLN